MHVEDFFGVTIFQLIHSSATRQRFGREPQNGTLFREVIFPSALVTKSPERWAISCFLVSYSRPQYSHSLPRELGMCELRWRRLLAFFDFSAALAKALTSVEAAFQQRSFQRLSFAATYSFFRMIYTISFSSVKFFTRRSLFRTLDSRIPNTSM